MYDKSNSIFSFQLPCVLIDVTIQNYLVLLNLVNRSFTLKYFESGLILAAAIFKNAGNS